MPLQFIEEPTSNLKIGLWKCTENLSQLLQLVHLTPGEVQLLSEIVAASRKTEFVVSRILIEKMTGYRIPISYEERGQPKLKNTDVHLSISHTNGFVAVAVNRSDATGIDVQIESPKIKKIAHKFLHESEQEFNSNDEALHVIWCCKEALFKKYSNHHPAFSPHLKTVGAQNPTNGLLGAVYTMDEWTHHELGYKKIENAHLVYIIGK